MNYADRGGTEWSMWYPVKEKSAILSLRKLKYIFYIILCDLRFI